MYSFFRNLHPALQLIVLVLLSICSSILVLSVAIAVAYPIWGDVVMEYSLENPDIPVSLHRYIQTASQIGTFLLPSILFVKLLSPSVIKYFKLSFSIQKLKPTFWAILSFILIIPFLDSLSEWNLSLHFPESLKDTELYWREKEETANYFYEILATDVTISGLFANLFVMAFIPAICEEFLFRGVIQQFLKKVFHGNIHLAVGITALIFTLFHMQIFSLVPRFLLGLLLGYIFEYGKSIIIPICAHFVNNALVVILSFLYRSGNISFNPEKVEFPGPTILWITASILLSGIAFYMFIRTSKNRKNISVKN